MKVKINNRKIRYLTIGFKVNTIDFDYELNMTPEEYNVFLNEKVADVDPYKILDICWFFRVKFKCLFKVLKPINPEDKKHYDLIVRMGNTMPYKV